MEESKPQERSITKDVMKNIDHAIHKYSRTPSLTSNQLIDDLKKETWEHRKKLPLMRENTSSETIAVKHICNTVLNNEKTFAKALDETIENSDLLNLRRKEVRFKKWQENVYVPVSKAVSATIDREHREFRRKKQRAYRDYLTLSNRQLVSYLDIDYNAVGYVGNRMYGPGGFGQRMKARIGRIQDPVHSCGTRRDHEDRTVVRCETGYTPTDEELVRRRYPRPTLPYVPQGRSNPPSDPNSWLMMKFSDINTSASAGSIPMQLRKRYITPKQLESSVDLMHLPAQMTREEVAQELAIPIRRRFVELMNRSANIEKLITMSNPTATSRRTTEMEKEIVLED